MAGTRLGRSILRWLAALAAVAAAGPVLATNVGFTDHFAGAALDPAWSVTPVGDVTGWTYDLSNSNLNVTDVRDGSWNTGWATYRLDRAVYLAGDFAAHLDFSWDENGSPKAVQDFAWSLLNASGDAIASINLHDAWMDGSAGRNLAVGSQSISTGEGGTSYAGSAAVDIIRTGSSPIIYWNGDALLGAPELDAVTTVRLEFSYFAYNGPWGVSEFGSYSVDQVSAPVPEPGSWCLGTLAAGALVLRRRALRRA